MTESNETGKARFDFRTFSIMLLIAIVPMLVGTWYLFASFEDAYLETVGTNLSDTAETAFTLINAYLQNQIITIAGLAETPMLRSVVAAGNQDLKRNLEEVRKSIPKMADTWATLGREAPPIKAILDNPASQFLRRYSTVNPVYRDIVITDFFGRTVASTAKTQAYYFAHDDWWKECYGDGRRGAVSIGDVRFDPAAKSYLMDIAQPFVEPDLGVVGVIRVVLDLQGLHSLVGAIQAGPGRSVALIHAKGDVISAPGYSSLQQSTFPATLDILNAREKEKAFFLSAESPQTMYGLAHRSFTQIYPHLNWIVFTMGRVADVSGPMPQLRRYFMGLLIGTFLLALIAALMISRVESKPILDQDPHLERL